MCTRRRADRCHQSHVGQGTLQGQDLRRELDVVVCRFGRDCKVVVSTILCSLLQSSYPALTLVFDSSFGDLLGDNFVHQLLHWKHFADVDDEVEAL